jgi:RNA polymerase sigma-70 factor, ECF subfamily
MSLVRGALITEVGHQMQTEASRASSINKLGTQVETRDIAMKQYSVEELRTKTDTELMYAFSSGNEYAYGVLYERLHKDIWRFTMKMMKYDEDKASDAFQEVFIRVYEKGDSFKGKGSVKSWMMMITRNVCLNAIRSEKRNAPIEEPDDLPTLDQSMEPEHLREQSALREIIEGAIDTLPEDLRESIVLREVEGLSYEEIAHQTNTNLGVVRQRIWRARQKLRKHLLPYLQDDYSFALDK